jgi:hypothetical protein
VFLTSLADRSHVVLLVLEGDEVEKDIDRGVLWAQDGRSLQWRRQAQCRNVLVGNIEIGRARGKGETREEQKRPPKTALTVLKVHNTVDNTQNTFKGKTFLGIKLEKFI